MEEETKHQRDATEVFFLIKIKFIQSFHLLYSTTINPTKKKEKTVN